MRSRIVGGQLHLGERLKPIREIAKDEGVSSMTVLKALEPLVAEGYLQRSGRRGLYVSSAPGISKTVQHIGLLVPTPNFIVSGVAQLVASPGPLDAAISGAGHRLSIHAITRYAGRGKPRVFVPAAEIATGLDAVIAWGIYDSYYLAELARHQRPRLAFDMDATSLGFDSACVDNVAAAFELTAALIRRGHRRIGFVGGPLAPLRPTTARNFDPAAVERADGYRLALRTFAPGVRPLVFHSKGGRHVNDFRATLEALKEAAPDCTAIVSEHCFDLPAAGMAQTELACFAPAPQGAPFGPAAWVHWDFDGLARAAAGLLLNRIKTPERPVQRFKLAPRIMLRQPDGPVSQGGVR